MPSLTLQFFYLSLCIPVQLEFPIRFVQYCAVRKPVEPCFPAVEHYYLFLSGSNFLSSSRNRRFLTWLCDWNSCLQQQQPYAMAFSVMKNLSAPQSVLVHSISCCPILALSALRGGMLISSLTLPATGPPPHKLSIWVVSSQPDLLLLMWITFMVSLLLRHSK